MVPKRLRILFSEDHPDTRELTCLILEKAGFEVVCPDTAQNVINFAKEEQFDAYLLDTWTPGLSGLEVCRQIREFDSHTPIIFYSAAVYQGDKDEAIAAGAQAYVAKPSMIDDLVDTIRKTIEGSEHHIASSC